MPYRTAFAVIYHTEGDDAMMQDGDGPDGVEVIGLPSALVQHLWTLPSGGFSLFSFAFPDPPLGVGELKHEGSTGSTGQYSPVRMIPNVSSQQGHTLSSGTATLAMSLVGWFSQGRGFSFVFFVFFYSCS